MRWLYLLAKLGLGACLADDMGLGKTIQVLSLLLVLKKQSLKMQDMGKPSLLVAPASLLSNWAAELERFAPSLKVMIAHTSALSGETLKTISPDKLASIDVVITSYALRKQSRLQSSAETSEKAPPSLDPCARKRLKSYSISQ
jgi:non-specific serine/threonine protein kinase